MRWVLLLSVSAHASGRLWSGWDALAASGLLAVPPGGERCLPGLFPAEGPGNKRHLAVLLGLCSWGRRPAGAPRGQGPGCSSEGPPGRGEGAREDRQEHGT